MAQMSHALPRPQTSWRNVGYIALGLAAVGLGLNLIDPSRVAALQNFLLVFSSLLIEAMMASINSDEKTRRKFWSAATRDGSIRLRPRPTAASPSAMYPTLRQEVCGRGRA